MRSLRGALIAVDTLAAPRESGDLSEPLARGVISAGDICLLSELIAASRPRRDPRRPSSKRLAWRTPILPSPSNGSNATI